MVIPLDKATTVGKYPHGSIRQVDLTSKKPSRVDDPANFSMGGLLFFMSGRLFGQTGEER
jgi:hypothetical protein